MSSLNERKNSTIIVEVSFNITYLVTVLILAFLLIFSKVEINLFAGIAAFILLIGDSFHLVPRVLAMLFKENKKFDSFIAIGKVVASITMTIFYIFLWQICTTYFSFNAILTLVFTIIILILASVRIILCLLKQNNWSGSNFKFAIIRNIPFVLLGCILTGFYLAGHIICGGKLLAVPILIILSFAFYLPVVFFSHRNPKTGMLMLPKSLAYIGMLITFLVI